MKWGTLYGADYVNRLYSMVHRNLSLEFKMVCFTDDDNGIIDEVDCYPIPEIDVPGNLPERMWKKLTTLKGDLYGLKGTALFLDLDVVIVDNIDCFFEVDGDFRIIKDYNKQWRITGNSSVYRFEIGEHPYVFDYFVKNFDSIRKEHRNEQEYLTTAIYKKGKLQYWPTPWCPSYKYDCVSRVPFAFWKKPFIPEGAKIIIFHGEINPPKAITGGRGKWYRYVAPAPWVAEYWK
jgi:hypothetical protein